MEPVSLARYDQILAGINLGQTEYQSAFRARFVHPRGR
jgi:hypothetical protein